MNRYGRIASDHWQQVAPTRYQEIENPREFFLDLGNQVEQRVLDLQEHLAGQDPPGEEYLQKVGRLNMARLQAEEMALAEMVWIEPEDPEDEEPDEIGRMRNQLQAEDAAEQQRLSENPE